MHQLEVPLLHRGDLLQLELQRLLFVLSFSLLNARIVSRVAHQLIAVSTLALVGQHAGRVAPVRQVRRLRVLEEGVFGDLGCQRYSLARLLLRLDQITGHLYPDVARRYLVAAFETGHL